MQSLAPKRLYRPPVQEPSVLDVMEAVAKAEGVPLDALTSKRRQHSVPRAIAMYLARQHVGLNYSALALRFSTDHSNARYACHRVADQLKRDSTFRERVCASHASLAQRFEIVPVDHDVRHYIIPDDMPRTALPTVRALDCGPITAAVAASQGLSVEELFISKSKEARFARALAVYLVRERYAASSTAVARAFGFADHTMVLYACKRIEEVLRGSPSDAAGLQQLRDHARRIELGEAPPLPPIVQKRLRPLECARAAVAVVAADVRLSVAEITTPRSWAAKRARLLAIRLVMDASGANASEAARLFGVDHSTASRSAEVAATDDAAAVGRYASLLDRTKAVATGIEPFPEPARPRAVLRPLPVVNAVVADAQGLSLEDLRYRETREAAFARGVAIHVAHTAFGVTYSQLAAAFGLRDHSTATRWERRIESLKQEPGFEGALLSLRGRVRLVLDGAIEPPIPVTSVQPAPLIVMPTKALKHYSTRVAGRDISTAPRVTAMRAPRVLPVQPPRVVPGAPSMERIVSVMQRCTVDVFVNGQRTPLRDLVRDGGGEIVAALVGIYLVDKLSALDAERLGLGAKRRAVLAQVADDEKQRRFVLGLRRAIEPIQGEVMREVGSMLLRERVLAPRLESRAIAVG